MGHGPNIEADEIVRLHTAAVCWDIHPTTRWIAEAVLARLADEKIVPENDSPNDLAAGDENVKLGRIGSD